MKLEYANLTCPKCGNGNYMRHLVGENVGELNVKCINCNSYFKLSDFYRMAGKAEAYAMTRADRIRAMTDEELVELFANGDCGYCRIHDFCFDKGCAINCEDVWLDWLRQEGE